MRTVRNRSYTTGPLYSTTVCRYFFVTEPELNAQKLLLIIVNLLTSPACCQITQFTVKLDIVVFFNTALLLNFVQK